jgi:uncharacterized protein YbaA (DUF1428 family)
MARYADGFVLPVPWRNAEKYRRIAQKAGKIWRARVPRVHRRRREGGPHHLVSAEREAEAAEAMWFSWIVFKSRKHRDRVNVKVMKDSRIAAMGPRSMPYDARRVSYGGFEVRVDV